MTTNPWCNGCGVRDSDSPVQRISLANGNLLLCQHCLTELNGKNPQLKAALDEVQKIRADIDLSRSKRLVDLEIENDKLKEALKPFASEVMHLKEWIVCDGHDGPIEECPLWKFTRVWHGDTGPTVADCQKAHQLIYGHDAKGSSNVAQS